MAGVTGPLDATPGAPTPEAPQHRPVLLHPLIANLQPRPGAVAIDATFGGGGVTAALADGVLPGGRVLAIDRDPEAVERGRARFGSVSHVDVVHGNFAELDHLAAASGIAAADLIAFDLGLSSIQLDSAHRGFSFRNDGPLDMRMDPSGGLTAADLVNTWSTEDLADLIRTYGDERFARSIARHIESRRNAAPLRTTAELREVVERSIPRHRWPARIHPATRTFQALRIEVNAELRSLELGLQAAIRTLRPGGRLGVISFHSLEDTLVKNALHVAAQNCLCPPQQPLCTCAHRASLSLITRRPIKPDDSEITSNPRARSARLRVAEKL